MLAAMLVWLALAARVFSADTPITESQVKALCLFNFAKYVTWPTEAFCETNAPLRIGVIAQSKLAADLAGAARGKSINGHPVEVLEPQTEAEWAQCQVLFIGASEKEHLEEIFSKVKKLPVLTVGESEAFAEAGGVIKFIKKENKVRFEVNLNASREAGLQISSKLLSLADVVRGKQ